jgi:hypothetical protein
MSLLELVDNTRTDKNTLHSYLPLYEELLSKKKLSAKHVLEIGIGDGHQGITNGGSIKLWHDYFATATIHAAEIASIEKVWDGIQNNDRIQLYTSTNAYDGDFVKRSFVGENIKFDMVLDDGPHTIQSMVDCIELYSPLIADDGILIIEDVQDISWLNKLNETVPADLKKYIRNYDLRKNKGRYDDIVFTIDKSLQSQ